MAVDNCEREAQSVYTVYERDDDRCMCIYKVQQM